MGVLELNSGAGCMLKSLKTVELCTSNACIVGHVKHISGNTLRNNLYKYRQARPSPTSAALGR